MARVKALIIGLAVLIAVPASTASVATTAGAASAGAGRSAKSPLPPELPKNFTGTGRYVVADLGLDVPFSWSGRDGNSQMIAGGEQYPIYFTNVIFDGHLYTLTYKWPDVARRPCSQVGPFTRDDFNAFMRKARFVGAETLEGRSSRRVNHFRAGVVFEPPPDLVPPNIITPVGGVPMAGDGNAKLRLPVMEGDFYVDRKDPTTFWQVLHFGLQNLYDPELDEWITMNTFSHRPGKVTLPDECKTAT